MLKAPLSYDHLSVMSAITMEGQLYTLIRDRVLASADSVRFLKHLRQEIKSKLWVIWDGSPIHRREVTKFMADGGSESVHLESLPPYAPDLNPDEGVWHYLKNVELRKVSCKDLKQLRRQLQLAIMRLRNKPHVIQSFFEPAGLTRD